MFTVLPFGFFMADILVVLVVDIPPMSRMTAIIHAKFNDSLFVLEKVDRLYVKLNHKL